MQKLVSEKSNEIIESLAKSTGVCSEDVRKIAEKLGIDKALGKLDAKELAGLTAESAKFGVRVSTGGHEV